MSPTAVRNIAILAALAAVLVLPFVLREKGDAAASPDETLVIVTPHNETIRYEFERGFRDWYKQKTGKTVKIDWRAVGGTSEIVMFVDSAFKNSFRNLWEKLGRTWDNRVQNAFANPKIELPQSQELRHVIIDFDKPKADTVEQDARRAFLASDIGIGIDLFFGGGSYEFYKQGKQGQLIPSGVLERKPEWFSQENDPAKGIPQNFRGEQFWDPEGKWFGACLSSFGLIYNYDVLKRLGIEKPPAQWGDLADPRYFGEIGAADPTKSGSINKVFEMIFQQQMQEQVRALGDKPPKEQVDNAVREGWARAMALIQKISANARYFTDSAPKPNLDVSAGDCAAGMSIDFYGRYQQETIVQRGGGRRFDYVTPVNGSAVSCDPIGMFRGAKHKALAADFIEFVLSPEGQKIWCFKTDPASQAAGGPHKFALRRTAIRPDIFRPELRPFLSDPDVNPFDAGETFVYRFEWTGRLFNQIRFIVKVAFIDVNDELRQAWQALIKHNFPPDATACFNDLSAVSYDEALTTIRAALEAPEKIEEVRLAKKISNQFRQQYEKVVYQAELGR